MLFLFSCFQDGCKVKKPSIPSSLILDGRLSTLLKCSVHLYKIASLSVRSVLPSAISNAHGDSRTLVLSVSWNFFMSFLSTKG